MKIFKKNYNSRDLSSLLFVMLAFSLLVGFYFDETISGIGAKADFYFTWDYVLLLEKNIVPPKGSNGFAASTPLHYMILSKLNLIFNNQEFVRLIVCLISILIPYLFYLNLKVKFPKTDESLLILLSCSVFLLPSFRYSAIWANTHITGLIFFLISTLFFLKWEKKKQLNIINKYLVYSTIFLALACYTRQYYALIFVYFLFIYFTKLNFLNFIKISFFIFVLSLPGFWLMYNDPALLKTVYTTRFYNTILINTSIISFFLMPIFIATLAFNKNLIHNKKNIIIYFLISIGILLFLLMFNFDYSQYNAQEKFPKSIAGGGFFFKLSYIFFSNPYFFYLTSFIGIFFVIYLFKEDKKSFLLFLLLIFGYSGYIIFQKWWEPTLLFVFFLLMDNKITNNFFKNINSLKIYYFYFILYFVSALINDFYKFSLNFNINS